MKKNVQVFFQTIRVFILFASCTILFYYGMMWIHQEYENYRRYEEPEGAAVKAFQSMKGDGIISLERLLMFYQNGE